MTAAMPIQDFGAFALKRGLAWMIEQLAELEDHLISVGRSPEAGSVRTTISDLEWQLEEYDEGASYGALR